ncbi:hypothetical protein H5P28_03630 [Ruficoccus amylovorans]|uniref:Uncharacterized protein n=1 Tax=Ruficoccus amylovorans TaxID=1804625 RepID=A0A842HCS1_9BACT|nr:hypothetical protein [Ruficoccus amylovorans]MBC2593344.1 hypothetical protein [Ruficoccus amylovorans]
MDASLLPSTPQIIKNIEEELRLNQEVSQLKTSVREMKTRLQQLESSFTLTERVGFVTEASENKRREISALATAINGQISVIKDRAERWKTLCAETERLLERFLSESDQEYRTGVRVKVFYRDLRKSLGDFQQAILDFLKGLGQARAAMCAQYDAQNRAFHANAHERFDEAAASGQRVDRAIRHFNDLADGHTDETRQTYLSHISLPRLTILHARQSVHTIREQDIATAHSHIDGAIDRLEKFLQTDLPALAEQIRAADSEHDETTTRYVEQYWEHLRHQIWQELQRGSTPSQHARSRLRLRRQPDSGDSHPTSPALQNV